MSPIYEVEFIKSADLLVEADNEEDALGFAEEILNYEDFGVERSASLVSTLGDGELICCEEGDFTFGELVELKEWIEAVEAQSAIDPNQRSLDV